MKLQPRPLELNIRSTDQCISVYFIIVLSHKILAMYEVYLCQFLRHVLRCVPYVPLVLYVRVLIPYWWNKPTVMSVHMHVNAFQRELCRTLLEQVYKWVNMVFDQWLREWKRRQGRPKTRWRDNLIRHLGPAGPRLDMLLYSVATVQGGVRPYIVKETSVVNVFLIRSR